MTTAKLDLQTQTAQTNGEARRTGAPKGMLPSTWLERTLRLEYVDSYGSSVRTTGTLLDCYPAGPILNISGAKTMLSWDRLVLCSLIND